MSVAKKHGSPSQKNTSPTPSTSPGSSSRVSPDAVSYRLTDEVTGALASYVWPEKSTCVPHTSKSSTFICGSLTGVIAPVAGSTIIRRLRFLSMNPRPLNQKGISSSTL